jgi:YVTN family beta-propeller protein
MKIHYFSGLIGALGLALLVNGCTDSSMEQENELRSSPAGEVWVANRGAASVSVIDVASDTVTHTLGLPDKGEPMYVNYSATRRRVFVGDRANHRIVVFNADTKELEATVPVGAGVFHQWVSADFRRLYVNNDIDGTTSVIDATTLKPIATIAMPTDLAALGGKPHDVFVDPDGSAVFVSYLGFEGDHDYVVRFDASTFKETHRAQVGKDPHLSATATNAHLYVPCQETNEVIVLRRDDLKQVKTLSIPGAHGAAFSPDGLAFYTTNLPGGGKDALFTINTKDSSLAGPAVDAARDGKPHNLVLSGDGSKLYVTHSGADAKTASVFAVDSTTRLPLLVGEVQVGANPFGLGFVPKPASGLPARKQTKVAFNLSALTTLRDGHHYEGWAIFDGKAVSTGKFNVDASGVATDLKGIAIPDGEFDAGRDLSLASALVITVEVPGDVDIVPNETHYLAGDLHGTSAILTTSHPAALGVDLAAAEGSFILATPTDGTDSNETSGVWFISLEMQSPAAGLSLPALPKGWIYEGWTVINGRPVSTGTFRAVDKPDDAAPFSSGAEPAPPFPGEDFLRDAPAGLSFPVDLSGDTVVVSIEPVPDDSAEPFALKPLAGAIPTNAADHQTFAMENKAGSFPVVTATLRE